MYVHPLLCSPPVPLLCSKGKVRKAAGPAEFKKQSIKYTAQKLHEKGVILEIEGLPNHQYAIYINGVALWDMCLCLFVCFFVCLFV